MDFNCLIGFVGAYVDDESVKDEMVSLLFSVKSFLDEDEMESIYKILVDGCFNDSAKLSAVRATCNQYL